MYTLTLNPSVDYRIILKDFHESSLNYALDSSFFAGGKGINVSIVLKNLGKSSLAFGFLGGFTGNYIKFFLDSEGINNDFTEIKSNTRINVKMNSNGIETEINANSPNILEYEFKSLLKKFKNLENNSILVMSGSVPESLGVDAYNEISKNIFNDIKLVIDTSGKPMKEILKLNPFLIKPNIHELEDLVNDKFNSLNDLVNAGKYLIDNGVQNIIVSMGENGAVFISNDAIYKAFVPKVNYISTIGAGDSVVAGFVYFIENENSIKDSFKFGVAAGTATVSRGSLCEFEDIKKMLDEVRIEDIVL